MRVIHILDHSIPLATPYAVRTMAILAAQRSHAWETFQLTGPNQGAGTATEEDIDGWRFYRTPPPGGILEGIPGLAVLEFMGEIAYRVERLARRVRPHVLHAHSPVLNAIPALRVGRRLGIPVVYEVRPAGEDLPVAADAPQLPRRLARAVETWVLRRADAVTTACEVSRSDVVVRGVPPTKVTFIAQASSGSSRCAAGAFDAAADDPSVTGVAAYCRVYEHLMEAM